MTVFSWIIVWAILVIICLLCYMVATVVHESAHALAALAFKFRVHETRFFGGREIGRIKWGGRPTITFGWQLWSGWTHIDLEQPGRWRQIAVIAAGPVSNLLLALFMLSDTPPWSTFGFVNLLVGLVQLIPLRGSDGYYIWKALRNREAFTCDGAGDTCPDCGGVRPLR